MSTDSMCEAMRGDATFLRHAGRKLHKLHNAAVAIALPGAHRTTRRMSCISLQVKLCVRVRVSCVYVMVSMAAQGLRLNCGKGRHGIYHHTVPTKHSGLKRFCWMCITAAMLYNTAAMSAEKATACMAPVSAGCAALLGCVAQWTSGRRSKTGAAVVGIGSGISAASRCGGHRPCPRIWPRAPRKNNCWR